jgi:ubiquinone/menaquinone biosynthesis C-methylase UbiE
VTDQRAFRTKVLLFLFCVFLVLVVLPIAWQFVSTLNRLDAIEKNRDQWQRPAEILSALALHEGSRVVDLGCGSGYFALKLSSAVGARGQVLAEDIRELSLIFLRVRAMLRHDTNITIIHGTADNPKLPTGAVDAVLVANTYHELDNPAAILACIRRALGLRGLLVVVDRGPPIGDRDAQHHHIARALAESQIRAAGFEVIARNDQFIDRPGDDPWWMLTARRP